MDVQRLFHMRFEWHRIIMNLTKYQHEPKSTSAREQFQKENFQNVSHLKTVRSLITNSSDTLTPLPIIITIIWLLNIFKVKFKSVYHQLII